MRAVGALGQAQGGILVAVVRRVARRTGRVSTARASTLRAEAGDDDRDRRTDERETREEEQDG